MAMNNFPFWMLGQQAADGLAVSDAVQTIKRRHPKDAAAQGANLLVKGTWIVSMNKKIKLNIRVVLMTVPVHNCIFSTGKIHLSYNLKYTHGLVCHSLPLLFCN